MGSSSSEYRSWSFTDRSFLFATAVSILWHLFWFFSVAIVVSPSPSRKSMKPTMVALGPVLDDAIFRTLLETKPEYSKTYYRNLNDFDSATDVPIQTIERHESGDVTSVPSGKIFERALKNLIGGDKAVPDGASVVSELFGGSDFFELAGDMNKDQILSRPDPPSLDLPSLIEIRFGLSPDGKVADMELVKSSGDAQTDRQWEDYFRQWLFSPSPVLGTDLNQKGKVTFKNPAMKE